MRKKNSFYDRVRVDSPMRYISAIVRLNWREEMLTGGYSPMLTKNMLLASVIETREGLDEAKVIQMIEALYESTN